MPELCSKKNNNTGLHRIIVELRGNVRNAR